MSFGERFALDVHFCPDCYEVASLGWEKLEEKYGESDELDDRIEKFEDSLEDLEWEYDSEVEVGQKENDLEYCFNQKCQCCGSKESDYLHHMVMPNAKLR